MWAELELWALKLCDAFPYICCCTTHRSGSRWSVSMLEKSPVCMLEPCLLIFVQGLSDVLFFLLRMVPTWLSSCLPKATRWEKRSHCSLRRTGALSCGSQTCTDTQMNADAHECQHTQSKIPLISCIQPQQSVGTPVGSWRNLTAWTHTDRLTPHPDKTPCFAWAF